MSQGVSLMWYIIWPKCAHLSPSNLRVKDNHALLSLPASVLHTWPPEPVYPSFCLIWTREKPRNLHHTNLNSQESGDVEVTEIKLSSLVCQPPMSLWLFVHTLLALGKLACPALQTESHQGMRCELPSAQTSPSSWVTTCLHREVFKGKERFWHSTNISLQIYFPGNLSPLFKLYQWENNENNNDKFTWTFII